MIFRGPRSRGVLAQPQSAQPQDSHVQRMPWSQALARRVATQIGDHVGTDGIVEKIAHSLAVNTARSYGGHFQRFVLWCEDQPDQPNPLPATSATVVRWLENDVCVGGRVAEQSLQPYLSGLNKVHDDLGYDKPALGYLLTAYRAGLARMQALKRKPERT